MHAEVLEEVRRGPGLDLFGLNPFRLLRIGVEVSSQEGEGSTFSLYLPKDPIHAGASAHR